MIIITRVSRLPHITNRNLGPKPGNSVGFRSVSGMRGILLGRVGSGKFKKPDRSRSGRANVFSKSGRVRA
jgi:hypothetical protein